MNKKLNIINMLAITLAMLSVSSSLHAEFRAGTTWHLVKDTYLLKRAARKLSRAAAKYIGDHPVSIESRRFTRVSKYFVYKINRYRLFTKKPDAEIVRKDFEIVRAAFDRLRLALRADRAVNSMPKIIRRYDKLIYRYHRLRHTINIHIAQQRKDNKLVRSLSTIQPSTWFYWPIKR